MAETVTLCYDDTITVEDTTGGDVQLTVHEDGAYCAGLFLTRKQSRKLRKALKRAERASRGEA